MFKKFSPIHKVSSWVIATYVLAAGIVGTADLEERFNGAYSYAASFKRGDIFSQAPTFGKHTLLGVPVYDTSIGFGYRLPFLYGTNTSPLVFLREIFTTQAIQLIVFAISLAVAVFAINRFFDEWMNRKRNYKYLTLLVIFDLAILGPSFVYTFTNDWSTQAVQYFGFCTLVAVLLERSVFDRNNIEQVFSNRRVMMIAVALVFSAIGHPGNLPNYFFVILLIILYLNKIHAFTKTVAWRLVAIVAFGLVLLIPIVIDIFLESSRQPFDRAVAVGWFSLADKGVARTVVDLTAATFYPLFSVFSAGRSAAIENVSIGFAGYAVILIALSKLRQFWLSRKEAPQFILILGVIVGCIVQMSLQNRLGLFRSSAAWQLRDPLVLLTSIFVVIYVGVNANQPDSGLQASRRNLLVCALSISALFPVATLFNHIRTDGFRSGVISEFISPPSNAWADSLVAIGVRPGQRVYVSDPNLFRFADWHGYVMQPQFVDLSLSTIQGWPKIRSSSTLTTGENDVPKKFLNLIGSGYGCREHELSFMSVDWVIDKDLACFEKYQQEFGGDSVEKFHIGENHIAEKLVSSVWAYRISPKHVFEIATLGVEIDRQFCPLLSASGCLNTFGIKPLIKNGNEFGLCISGCVARATVSEISRDVKVVFPLDFDRALSVYDLNAETFLPTDAYHGLLKVDLGSSATTHNLEIRLKPDWRMRMNAASTWLALIGLLAFFAFKHLGARNFND